MRGKDGLILAILLSDLHRRTGTNQWQIDRNLREIAKLDLAEKINSFGENGEFISHAQFRILKSINSDQRVDCTSGSDSTRRLTSQNSMNLICERRHHSCLIMIQHDETNGHLKEISNHNIPTSGEVEGDKFIGRHVIQ